MYKYIVKNGIMYCIIELLKSEAGKQRVHSSGNIWKALLDMLCIYCNTRNTGNRNIVLHHSTSNHVSFHTSVSLMRLAPRWRCSLLGILEPSADTLSSTSASSWSSCETNEYSISASSASSCDMNEGFSICARPP